MMTHLIKMMHLKSPRNGARHIGGTNVRLSWYRPFTAAPWLS